MKFTNKFGTINVLKEKNKFRNRTIGISMSGGMDSTMLCILLAKTIESKGLHTVIQPYNGYDIWAPLDSAGLPNIINRIRKDFPTVKLRWPISTVFNTGGDNVKDKNTYIRPLVRNLMNNKVIYKIMPGISMGPPMEDQLKFNVKDAHCAIQRLPGYRLWNEVEEADDNLAPYKHIDKRFIVQCYKDFGYEDLIPMTQSCTDPKGNCGQCWWCEERKWAIDQVFNGTE